MLWRIPPPCATKKYLLLLLWMALIIAAMIEERVAIPPAHGGHRSSKNSQSKRNGGYKAHNMLDPYHYAHPTEQKLSPYSQYLNPPPIANPYGNRNNAYDSYYASSYPTNDQPFASAQPEYQYTAKSTTSSSQHQSNLPHASSLPAHASSVPTILLVHAAGGGNHQVGSVQTFLLVPTTTQTDSKHSYHDPVGHYPSRHTSAASGIGVPSVNVIPIPPSSVLTPMIQRLTGSNGLSKIPLPKGHLRGQSNSHLLKRPIMVYQLPTAPPKYLTNAKNHVNNRELGHPSRQTIDDSLRGKSNRWAVRMLDMGAKKFELRPNTKVS